MLLKPYRHRLLIVNFPGISSEGEPALTLAHQTVEWWQNSPGGNSQIRKAKNQQKCPYSYR
ncbi:hypothetical protein H6G00_34060 [Leptolyngbya sp. FACHB-541]|uniref:hypothetical protein n=1 Tax=Leptolyngbya sp. FACHB-541 TaxID=2692810 RepID=UPI001681E978|nr:hypothetical protein [Leptolyngbya sp. FACHB-541]MBD2001558.1 hypothetical protein [Leptolyngbya sp. FACHB-541]